MVIFDGITTAAVREKLVKTEVESLAASGIHIAIGAIVFREDAGSQLYTRLKSEAAARVGIQYIPQQFSITDSIDLIGQQITSFNSDNRITGIIIQKPTKRIWHSAQHQQGIAESELDQRAYDAWWKSLTAAIDPQKDVDGLHPDTLLAIADGTWERGRHVLPATCQAVVDILEEHCKTLQQTKVIIIGKSDLLGTPLAYYLKNRGVTAELLRRVDLEERMKNGSKLLDADVVVSATGVENLVNGDMIKDGVIIIDVGEPRPDVNQKSVSALASFITPVPGGVGPMTVVSLLANAVKLAQHNL
jgi:methylenetetrahydrofolate dehydrogenase (NADP+)/methenyltetrahydrofolate cyclohydrolase